LSVYSTNLTRPRDPLYLARLKKQPKLLFAVKRYEQFPSKGPSKIAEVDGARESEAVSEALTGWGGEKNPVFTGEAQQWWRVLAILNLRGPVAGSVEPATSPAGVDLERRRRGRRN
jgi:hypothetical protein